MSPRFSASILLSVQILARRDDIVGPSSCEAAHVDRPRGSSPSIFGCDSAAPGQIPARSNRDRGGGTGERSTGVCRSLALHRIAPATPGRIRRHMLRGWSAPMKIRLITAVFAAIRIGGRPTAVAPGATWAHPAPRHALSNPRPIAGILFAWALAFMTAGWASTPTRAAEDTSFQSYAIVAVDDRGVLSAAELADIQIGIVQYLVTQGYVHAGQVFTTDVVHADVVFRVGIAWQGTETRFTIVAVAPIYGDRPATTAPAPAAPSPDANDPDDTWPDDDIYDYPDFGYAYGPYAPFLGIAPFFPFFDYGFHRRSPHPDHRPPLHRPPWRNGDRRHLPSSRPNDHPPAPPPRLPQGRDRDDHRPPTGTWHSRDSGPAHRPPPTTPLSRHLDNSGVDHRPPPSRLPGGDSHRPPADHRPPPTASTARPQAPDRDGRPPPREMSTRHPPVPVSALRSLPPGPSPVNSPRSVTAGRPPPPPRSSAVSAGSPRGPVSTARPPSAPAPRASPAAPRSSAPASVSRSSVSPPASRSSAPPPSSSARSAPSSSNSSSDSTRNARDR